MSSISYKSKAAVLSLLLTSAAMANPVARGNGDEICSDYTSNQYVKDLSKSAVKFEEDLKGLEEQQKKEERWQKGLDDALRAGQNGWSYVHQLADRDIEAASWFTTLGGQRGFIWVSATPEQYKQYEDTIKKVIAKSIGGNAYQKAQMERYRERGRNSNDEFFTHIKNIDRLVNNLEKEIRDLNAKVTRQDGVIAGLRAELATEKRERQADVTRLDSRIAQLAKDLADEKAARIADKTSFEARIKSLENDKTVLGNDKRTLEGRLEKKVEDLLREERENIKKQHQAELNARDAATAAALAAKEAEKKLIEQRAADSEKRAADREKMLILEFEVKSLGRDKADLLRDKRALEETLEKQKGLKDQVVALEQENKKLEATIKEINFKIDAANADLTRLRAELDTRNKSEIEWLRAASQKSDKIDLGDINARIKNLEQAQKYA